MFKMFSLGHLLLFSLIIGYTAGLCLLLRKRTKRTQIIVLGALSLVGVALFAFRWRLLIEMLFFNRQLSAGEFGGLLPLELCNIGTFVLPFTIFIRKRKLIVFSFYVNLVGALLAIIILPGDVQSTYPWKLKFFDYFILHANLVALPFTIVSCGWYKLQMKDTVLATVLFFLMFVVALGINYLLELLNWVGDHCNYLFVRGPKGFVILSQLWSLIPIPFIYLLPLAPFFWGIAILATLPFIKKHERKEQFKLMLASFKTLGFKNQ